MGPETEQKRVDSDRAKIVEKQPHPEEVTEAEIPSLLTQQSYEIDKLVEVVTELEKKLGPVLTQDLPNVTIGCADADAKSDIGTRLSRNNQRIDAITQSLDNIFRYIAL